MTLGSHQQSIGRSQNHLTPRFIIDALGPFDTDPCAADPRPWDCAGYNIVEKQNGLALQWNGFVWLNPPFHRYRIKAWLERMAAHAHGIALVHARTETDWFRLIWENAGAILFLYERLIFCKPDGSPQTIANPQSKHFGKAANSGAPVCLAAFGLDACRRLEASTLAGALVTDWRL